MPICDDDRNLLSVVAKACYAERQLSKPDREISWPVVRFLLLDVMRKNHGGGTGHRNIFFVTAQWHHPAFCFQSLIMTGEGLGTVFMIRRDERYSWYVEMKGSACPPHMQGPLFYLRELNFVACEYAFMIATLLWKGELQRNLWKLSFLWIQPK